MMVYIFAKWRMVLNGAVFRGPEQGFNFAHFIPCWEPMNVADTNTFPVDVATSNDKQP